jgi:hypothetical protein
MSSSVASRAARQGIIQEHVPKLSKAHAQVMGLWSSGMVLSRRCGLTQGSHGVANGEQVPANPPAPTRMGRRVDGEAGREAPGGEGRGVFCGSAEMGPHDLERSAPMGLGARCTDLGDALDGTLDLRGLSGVRDRGGVETAQSGRAGRRERARGRAAHATGGSGAVRVGGGGDGGSGMVCGVAVSSHPGTGLASACARESRSERSWSGRSRVSPNGRRGVAAWAQVGRRGCME